MNTGCYISANRLMRVLSLGLTVLFITVTGEIVRAQIPNTLNYQGVLTGTDGKPVADGQYKLTFKLYTQATGGSAMWSETQNTMVANGVFSVLLGKVTSLASVPFNKPYWLGITVGSGSEMLPRVELSTSAYSLRSRAVADSSVTGAGIARGQVIRNVNGMTDSVSIEAGSNVSIQKSAHKLTISSTGGGSSPWTVSNNNVYYTTGDVGIGTTTPATMLDISGLSGLTSPQLWLRDTGANNYSRINFSNASGNNFWAIAAYNNTDQTKERLNFYNHATGDLMSITGDGRVGMGVGATSSKPNSLLTVKSHHTYAGYFSSDSSKGGVGLYAEDAMNGGMGIDGEGSIVGVNGATSGSNGLLHGWSAGVEGGASALNNNVNYGVYGYAENATVNYSVYGLASGATTTSNYAVYADGDLAYTGTLIHASDAKFKENVQPLSPVLSKVMELAPKSYTFRKDPAYRTMDFSPGKQYGVVAQDVEKVFPSLVVDAVDPGIDPKNPKAPTHPVHYKGVKYLQMIPILLEAIKEQQQEIKDLKKLVIDQGNEIQSLKK